MLPPPFGAATRSERGKYAHPAMTENEKPVSLQELDDRLKRARGVADKSAGRVPRKGDGRSGLGIAMRLGVELVSALVIGVALGYFLDVWLGTKPWLMLLGFVLGAAAGFMGVYRVATGLGQTVGYRHDKHEQSNDDDGSDENAR